MIPRVSPGVSTSRNRLYIVPQVPLNPQDRNRRSALSSPDYDPISRVGRREDVKLARPGGVRVCRKFSPPLETRYTAERARRGIVFRGILKGFEKYCEDLPQGSYPVRARFPGVPSDELSKSFVLGSGGSCARVPILSLPPDRLRPPLIVFWIYFYVSFLLCIEVAPRDPILSARPRTVDMSRSGLFTVQSILRDVGVPISIASARSCCLFFAVPVYEFTCLRRTLCACRLFIHSSCLPPLYHSTSSTSLSRYIIVKNSVFCCFACISFA